MSTAKGKANLPLPTRPTPPAAQAESQPGAAEMPSQPAPHPGQPSLWGACAVELNKYQAALDALGASLGGLENLYAQRAPLESELAALTSQREQLLQGLIRRKPADGPRSPEKEAEIGKLDIRREVLAGQAEFLEREIIEQEDALQRELCTMYSDLTRAWQELKAWTWSEALERVAQLVDPDFRALQRNDETKNPRGAGTPRGL